ncbi:major DNA-binding protein [Gallid alphaherpesvirus 3]|uniref:Major DNA-binding protein n=2 Tax=Mardivirus TaxID=180252 RepID=F8TC23_9ALPH|nr:major DNA-binding protein [Gallid alphaherpesvirus 3]AEI00234.1 major DNA-binding protein [Gallid alphaherpesvirus 3]QEY02215.1 major DNA-binding protein [Gallid alphaherpesvirus 3]BAA83753.1 homolog of HSV-1 glycoprotein [Gallid alphaherpesvirus 2]
MDVGKSVKITGGPIGYVYAAPTSSMPAEDLSIFAAKSNDCEDAILPLVSGLTVEADFMWNVAAVAGTKTTGLGSGSTTLKLVPTHYHPCVFVFHGGECIKPCTKAPNLTKACDLARGRFGYSTYSPPVATSFETTGEQICDNLGMNPQETMLYLVVTELFKEAVYLCNSYLHYGGTGVVSINGVDVRRIPLYPLHLVFPDFNRVASDPFSTKPRALGEGALMPKAFYNDSLCRLLHGYVLSTAAVGLRVRNVDAIARCAAHLSFDENHEGTLLPADTAFNAFTPIESASKSQYKAGKKEGMELSGGGYERRTASLMASDATLSIENVIATSVYEESIPDVKKWPLYCSPIGYTDRVEALSAYMARVAGLVGAMVFSSNSVIYMTEVGEASSADGKDTSTTAASFYRFFQIAAPHLASNPLIDRDGKPIPGEDLSKATSASPSEYSLDYLILACGFCPQLLARFLFYLERCDGGSQACHHDLDTVKFVSSAMDADVPCDLCDKASRIYCAHTTIKRLEYRLPKFGYQMRGAMGLFGSMTNNYCDVNALGSYAPFSTLKRSEGETSRSVMQDTYKLTVERVMKALEKEGLLTCEDPADMTPADAIIRDGKSFMRALSTMANIIESEAGQLMRNLTEIREYNIREGLGDATHTLSLAIEPYSSGICPVLSFLSRRTIIAVVQDMALSQCSMIMHGQQVEARNFRTQFQAVLRRRVLDLQNAGFITSKNITVTLEDQQISVPDPSKSQHDPLAVHMEGDLVKVTFEIFREFKVKNKVMFVGGVSSTVSDATKSRLAGMIEAYQRPAKAMHVLNGPLGFALKRYHTQLFPNVKMPNGTTPNALWFWILLQRNQLPAGILSKDAEENTSFIKRFTNSYADMNYINISPTCFGELAQFYLANTILRYCSHKHFFINTISALVATSKRPRDPAMVLPWIEHILTQGSDVAPAAQQLLKNICDHKEAWCAAFSSTNLVGPIMASKPFVVIAVSISKYHGMAGSTKVFQSGNWGNIMGGRNVCSIMSFNRTHRFVMACPRVGFVSEQTGFSSGLKETTLVDRARAVLSEECGAPHAAVYMIALKMVGDRVRQMELDDWMEITNDAYISSLIDELNKQVEGCEGGWSVDAAAILAKEMVDMSKALPLDGPTFNYDALDENTERRADGPSILEPTLKRPCSDVFDLEPVPEKRAPGLSVDML